MDYVMKPGLRPGMSNVIASLLLISIAISSGVIVYSAFNGLAAASGPPSASLQVTSGKLVQGTNEATLSATLANQGSQPITSLAITMSGVQSVSGSFSAQIALTGIPGGGQLYSGSFTVPSSSTTVSYSFSVVLNPSQNADLVVTFVASTAGTALFTAGNSYSLGLSSQPSSLASILLTAQAP